MRPELSESLGHSSSSVIETENSKKATELDSPNSVFGLSVREIVNPVLDESVPPMIDTEYENSSSFLPETDEGNDGFFIEDEDTPADENDISQHHTDVVGENETDYMVPSKAQPQEQDEACDDTALLSSSPSTMAAFNFPTRSILKADVEEIVDFPINLKKNKWKQLPAPDMEYVKMKRIESLNSLNSLSSMNRNSCASLMDLTTLEDKSPPEQEEPQPPRESSPKSSPDSRPVHEKQDSRVKFQHIVVREYQQTIGDNPSVAYGAPISLDWDYQESEPLDVDLYEGSRGGRRSVRQMHLNSYQRKNIFVHKYGFTDKEVKQAKKATNKVKSQREFSKMMHTSLQPLLVLEEMRESAVRKFRRYRRRNTVETCQCTLWMESIAKGKGSDQGTDQPKEEQVGENHPEFRRAQSAPPNLEAKESCDKVTN